MKREKNYNINSGITLIALVVTIIVLLILTGVAINLLIKQRVINKTITAAKETEKQIATEEINLKITNKQIDTYAEDNRMPTLQELADYFCEDKEIQYVTTKSKNIGALEKITVGDATSIFTKLKEYPYEFEIDNNLRLASVDGMKILADANNNSAEIEELKSSISELKSNIESLESKIQNQNAVESYYSTEEQLVGKWIDGKNLYQKTIVYNEPTTGNAWIDVGKIDDMDTGFVDASASYYINNNSNMTEVGATVPINSAGRNVDIATYTSYASVYSNGRVVVGYGSTTASTKTVVTVKYTKASE